VLLRTGPLGTSGGVALCGGMPDPVTWAALRDEAVEARPAATRHDGGADATGADRDRTPSRSLASAPGGPVQDVFYASPALAAYVAAQVGVPVTPSGRRGSYSYYERPGDHLALHVDVHGCDVTLVTVLHDDTGRSDPGGAVLAYRTAVGVPLDEIAAGRWRGSGDVVKAQPGQSILLLGGLVPHRVLPLTGPGSRVVAPLCFTAVLG
jgi:hypothetical protein